MSRDTPSNQTDAAASAIIGEPSLSFKSTSTQRLPSGPNTHSNISRFFEDIASLSARLANLVLSFLERVFSGDSNFSTSSTESIGGSSAIGSLRSFVAVCGLGNLLLVFSISIDKLSSGLTVITLGVYLESRDQRD